NKELAAREFGSLPELVQHVLRDAGNVRVVAAKAETPVGAANGDHRSAASVGADDRVADAALLPLLVPLAIVGVPLRGRSGEHLEVFRSAVGVRGEGEAVLPDEFAPVALVAHR